jgi:hypothetical protein
LDENGVIVSKNGLKPDIHCSCDVNIFKRLVKNVYRLNTGKRRDKWRVIDEKYHVIFNGDKHILTTIASDENDHTRDVIEEVILENINGNADIYYYYGFAEVMSVLTGEIDLHALESGPLWIAQDSDTRRIRYLIFPIKP